MKDKMDLASPDLVNENVKRIAELFPNCVTETENGKAIDFDLLKQELNHEVIEGNKERYRLEWPGKREAIVTANIPTTKTLRPVREDSVDFDTTQNIYIEGDNLEVLKLLQESYLGKIKMIYIDPPYNTGKDFVYKDNFKKDAHESNLESGFIDEEGNQLVELKLNPETAAKYHSNWLSMMYPRLKLARNLLAEDGVIFLSIDDNEEHNLRKISDEIFGEDNFVANLVRKRRDSQANLSKNISPIHEYILIYAKNNGEVLNKIIPELNLDDFKNPDNDPRGSYVTMPCTNKGGNIYEVTLPTGRIIKDEWRFKKETFDKLLSENKIVVPKGGEGKPRYKLFLEEKKESGVLANTWLDKLPSNQEGTREIKSIFTDLLFDTPKPIGLIEFLLKLSTSKQSITLDFFSGSATTAHAVMQLNSQDKGNRKFIMVQVPELIDEKSEAYDAGYKTICEIGKERIRRAGKKLQEDAKREKDKKSGELALENESEKDFILDTGFRVFRLAESNMKDVYYRPQDFNQDQLDAFADNIKEDRTADDLLVQIMLDWGLPLSLGIEQLTIANKEVFKVAENSLLACFDSGINEAFAKEVAKHKPLRVVFKDSSFEDNSAKENVKQLLKQLSPTTEMKVI